MSKFIEFRTSDDKSYKIKKDYSKDMCFFQKLSIYDSEILKISIPSHHMDFILDFLYKHENSIIDYDLLKKPSLKPVHEYLKNNLYKDFFNEKMNLKEYQNLYNSCDYLHLDSLCKLILSHISYHINTSEELNIDLPEKKGQKTYYNFHKKIFEYENIENMKEDILNLKKTWKYMMK